MITYLYFILLFPPSSVPTMDAIIWNDCRAYDVEICIDDKQ